MDLLKAGGERDGPLPLNELLWGTLPLRQVTIRGSKLPVKVWLFTNKLRSSRLMKSAALPYRHTLRVYYSHITCYRSARVRYGSP